MRRDDATIRQRAGTVLAAAAAAAAMWTVIVLLSGGVSIRAGTWQIVSRDPVRPLLLVAMLAFIAWWLLGTRESWRTVRRLAGDPKTQLPARVAFAAAACTLVVSIAWNTRAAGGSDSSCYVLQAEAFGRGGATLDPPLSLPTAIVPPVALAPIGFVPSATAPDRAVPICAPGLALAMVPAWLLGRDAVFLVVPLFASLAVWCTYLFGRALGEDLAGACGAALLACSPIFLYQSVQPMSDVPAAALWMAALVALCPPSPWRIAGGGAREIVAGVCASWAVLMRPNMALVVVPLLALLRDGRAWLRFALASLPAAAVMLGLNATRYGSPFASGYGSTEVLFSLAHVRANLARYPKWLLESHSVLLIYAIGAPWILWRRGQGRIAAVASVAVGLVFLTYLAYTVFDDWWYIRFLLPALPVLIVFMLIGLRSLTAGMPRLPWWTLPLRGRPLFFVVVGILVVWFLVSAIGGHAFELQRLEARFRLAGDYAGRAFPRETVVLAVQQSGSVRYYGSRGTLAWDGLPRDGLDATIAAVAASGRPVFFALEDAEEPRFRDRFAGQRFGALDWPPFAEVHGATRVRFYDPAQRARYLEGERYPVEFISSSRPR